MRYFDIRLTMGTYTDPKLLDIRGALDVLPMLALNVPPSSDCGALPENGPSDRNRRAIRDGQIMYPAL
jgi:hypothetical protein